MDDPHAGESAVALGERRIRDALQRLPDGATPEFWPALRDPSLPLEVLVTQLRRFHHRGLTAETNDVADILLQRAFPIALEFAKRAMQYSPHLREDMAAEAIALMWKHIATHKPFWERNFRYAFKLVCVDAVRKFLPRHRSADGASRRAEAAQHEQWDEPRAADPIVVTDGLERGAIGLIIYEQAMAVLTPEEREAWRLEYETPKRRREIAAHLGCTERTIYDRLERARNKLAVFFSGEESENV